MTPQKRLQMASLQSWVLLPLRLFLGITFIYAGIQKITDPQFFNPHAAGYIGKQIVGIATGSPLHDFLLNVAEPHSTLFGLLVIFGEIAIGLGTLSGFLFRPAAFFGMFISLLFFLSASWNVYPYFYGADIVFTFCWLTLLLNGPLNTGLPTLDELITLRLLQTAPPQQQTSLTTTLCMLLGTSSIVSTPTQTTAPKGTVSNQRTQPIAQRPAHQQRRQSVAARQAEARRNFLWGTLTGGIATLGILALGYAWNILQHTSDTTANGTTAQAAVPATSTVEPGGTPSTTSTAGATPVAGAIAQASAVPKNSAVNFTIPSSNDPGILVHLNNGQFVAYDAVCTHAGCQVDYDSSSQLLQCPCHGAAFDPAQAGAVVQRPARTPLSPVKIQVDNATGAITLS